MKMPSAAMKHFLLLLTFSTSCVEINQAFTQQNGLWDTNHRSSNFVAKQRSNFPPLLNSMGNKEEKSLREELARKNEEIENEEIYAVMEGITVDVEEETEATLTAPVASSYDEKAQISSEMMSLKRKIERVTKPRAYPLFLAETACNVAEDIAKSLFFIF